MFNNWILGKQGLEHWAYLWGQMNTNGDIHDFFLIGILGISYPSMTSLKQRFFSFKLWRCFLLFRSRCEHLSLVASPLLRGTASLVSRHFANQRRSRLKESNFSPKDHFPFKFAWILFDRKYLLLQPTLCNPRKKLGVGFSGTLPFSFGRCCPSPWC